VQTGAFAGNFTIDLLILIYAVVILGGTGSLAGMIVGAVFINVSYSVLASQNAANTGRILFYAVIVLVIAGLMRPWKYFAATLGATVVFGFVVHAFFGAVWSPATKGQVTDGAFLAGPIRHWVLIPSQHTGRIADYAYIGLVVAVIVASQLKGWWRVAGLAPTLYLTAFVWENLLVENRAVTRLILFGALLIGIMTVRPQGLFGTAKVEIV
jgi:ABC-type branched-subunit amino acid transport system permease subunit